MISIKHIKYCRIYLQMHTKGFSEFGWLVANKIFLIFSARSWYFIDSSIIFPLQIGTVYPPFPYTAT